MRKLTKIEVLSKFIGCHKKEINKAIYDKNIWLFKNNTYLVLTAKEVEKYMLAFGFYHGEEIEFNGYFIYKN
jgi:hypothetical protein